MPGPESLAYAYGAVFDEADDIVAALHKQREEASLAYARLAFGDEVQRKARVELEPGEPDLRNRRARRVEAAKARRR